MRYPAVMSQNIFPRLLPVNAVHSYFFSFFLLLSMRTGAGLYLHNLICHLGVRLSSRWRPRLWQCLELRLVFLSLVCNQSKFSQCSLLEPSDTADHQPKPASDRQKFSLGSTISRISMAQLGYLILDIWCHLRWPRLSLLWLLAAASGECHMPCMWDPRHVQDTLGSSLIIYFKPSCSRRDVVCQGQEDFTMMPSQERGDQCDTFTTNINTSGSVICFGKKNPVPKSPDASGRL